MILSCGDSLFDLFIQADDSSQADVALKGGPGGSPMNVALGLARLGQNSYFLSPIGKDLYAKRLRDHLQANKINLSLCPDTDRNTTLAIIEKNPDGSAEYVFYLEGSADTGLQVHELPDPLPNDLRCVHFGSYSTVFEPVATALRKLATLAHGKAIISYDVNEESAFVEHCFNSGAELVFITRGPDGASAFSKNGGAEHHRGFKIDVVDTVGAGDTFQATMLHFLTQYRLSGGESLAEIDLAACLELSLKAASITCTRHGADLPYLSELE